MLHSGSDSVILVVAQPPDSAAVLALFFLAPTAPAPDLRELQRAPVRRAGPSEIQRLPLQSRLVRPAQPPNSIAPSRGWHRYSRLGENDPLLPRTCAVPARCDRHCNRRWRFVESSARPGENEQGRSPDLLV